MKSLTDRTVKTAPPGRHGDGTVKGLMLVVRDSGARGWVLRYQIGGRRRDMGLGPYPEVGLADARDAALENRRLIRNGVDPLAQRTRTKLRTFKETAEALIESKKPGWRNAKHATQWTNTLKTYAYPKLGSMDVKTVDTDAVLDVLRPIWTGKTETASRVRQRIEAVLDYATAIKARTGENPARWKGHLDHLLAKPSKVRAVEHHAALDWREAPAFMAELAKREGISPRALAFTILTAARSGEVRGMRWSEIDLEVNVWTVPASRIKAGKEHRVPPVVRGDRAARRGRRARRTGVCEPCRRVQAPVRYDAGSRAQAHGRGRDRPRLPVHLPRLGWRDDGASAGGHRGEPGAQAQGQGRSRLRPW
jgi:integrase